MGLLSPTNLKKLPVPNSLCSSEFSLLKESQWRSKTKTEMSMSWVKTKAYMKCEGEGGTGWPFCPKVLYLKLGTIPLISFYTLEVGVFIGRDRIGTSHPVFHPEKRLKTEFLSCVLYIPSWTLSDRDRTRKSWKYCLSFFIKNVYL